jgi:hypothetical protein
MIQQRSLDATASIIETYRRDMPTRIAHVRSMNEMDIMARDTIQRFTAQTMFPIIQQVSTIRLQIVHRVSANANTDT